MISGINGRQEWRLLGLDRDLHFFTGQKLDARRPAESKCGTFVKECWRDEPGNYGLTLMSEVDKLLRKRFSGTELICTWRLIQGS